MGHFVEVTIWEPILPLDRGERYEDPLATALHEHGLGEVTGGGTRLTAEKEISLINIDLDLANLDVAVPLVKKVLVSARAPAGSELRYQRGGQEIVETFGTCEGLAVYLDGVGLSDAVYDECDINELADQILEVLIPLGGEMRGAWMGPTETSIYLYGPSADEVFEALEPILTAYPLCQNARVVIRHGNPKLGPRTVRLPRHS
jgi:hypothetical protein